MTKSELSIKKELVSALKKVKNPDEAKRIFENIQISQKGNILNLTFPHRFSLDLFKNHYLQEIIENTGYHLQLDLRGNKSENNQSPPKDKAKAKLPFGQDYSFENFLHNQKNYFPWVSSKEIAEKNTVEFNPLVLFGKNSTGKTHLLRSIANHIIQLRQIDPESIYLGNMENISNLYNNNYSRTREFLSEKDFLFIDDIHLLLGQEELQKEFILLFNHFYEEKKQMIFCFTGPLSILDNLDPNLKSRLEWGLLLRLKRPDLDVRIRYIKNRCREKNLNLSKEQILAIAERFEDIRILQGIILKLFAFNKLVTPEISTEDFQSILSSLDQSIHEKNISFEELVQLVCEEIGTSPQEIFSQGRSHKIVFARQIGMYLARKFLPFSYPEIGKKFGNRDHSTVMYSIKKIEELKENNPEVKNLLKNLIAKCHLINQ